MKTNLRMTKRFAVVATMVTIFFAWSCDQFEADIVPDETKTTVEDTDIFTAENSSAVIDLKSLVKSYSNVTLTITDQPDNGRLEKIQDAVFSYKPKKDFKGSDMFIFRVSSNNQTVATDSVIIHVGDGPVEIPCGLYAQYDSTVIPFNPFPAPRIARIDVLANDHICGVNAEDIKIEIFSQPENGRASVDEMLDEVGYTPNGDHVGADWFIYRISDKNDTTNFSLALVSVFTADDPSCHVTLNPDFLHLITNQSNVYTFNVFTNDELCAVDSLNDTFTIIKNGDNGSAVITGFGLMLYDPTASALEHGDSLIYKYCHNDVCYTQGVRLSFEVVQCSVLALGDTVDLPFNAASLTRKVTVLDNDELCGNAVEIGITKAPMNGTASFDGFDLYYTANSQTSPRDSVRYMVCNQENKCGTGWVVIRRE
jgi:hypothetical protein